jgi:predicted dehydrogenase
MLDKEKDLDAVIVASPDWVHAEHAIAGLKAGLHVYCEKEMSNTVENARQMVLASRQAGKLLQIGHQRRSNPRYFMALDYINTKKCLGRMTHVMGQWNRDKPLYKEDWNDKTVLDKATLAKYGYDSMHRFRNWRWYKKFSGGPIADLGSHQIDIFHWFLHALPKSVMAAGGSDNYGEELFDAKEYPSWKEVRKGVEWYDNVLAVYEWDYDWEGEKRTVHGHYQLCSTTSHGGFAETFMGTEGSLVLSESTGKGGIRREYSSAEAPWEKELQDAVVARAATAADLKKQVDQLESKLEQFQKQNSGGTPEPEKKEEEDPDLKIGHSVPEPGRYYPPIPAPVPPKTEHGPHLENFFDAVRGKAKLNCPGEEGLATAVSVLRVNEALEAGKTLPFKPEDFKA